MSNIRPFNSKNGEFCPLKYNIQNCAFSEGLFSDEEKYLPHTIGPN